jgi:hypothetical protein
VSGQVRTENLSIDPLADAEEKEKARRKRREKPGPEDPDAKKRKREDTIPGATPDPTLSDATVVPRQTSQVHVVTRPVMLARGHTGYLTFARRIVDMANTETLGGDDTD